MSKSVIDAAFSSSKAHECYIFVKEKYVVVNYAPGGKKKDIISPPTNIIDGFPMFAKTLFQHGIDCSFDADDNVAFIFSGKQCAKVVIGPNSGKARLLQGPIPINAMFPSLKATVFENGIDAIMRSSAGKNLNLFKGDVYGNINSDTYTFKAGGKIGTEFPIFLGTVFEGGIDAAFNSHDHGECYIFKGKYYAQYSRPKRMFLNGYIKLIHDDWPALHSIL